MAIRLPSETNATKNWIRSAIKSRTLNEMKRVCLKSIRLQGTPLRLRPAFIIFTTLSLLTLGLLGFHPTLATSISPPVPFSDKILHFVGFLIASFGFYCIWVVEESRSRSFVWRYWSEWLSFLVCCCVGGILSEYVQALLPYKTFQWGDVLANLLGSSLGIYAARFITRAHQRRQELQKLYEPLDLSALDDSDAESDSDIPILSSGAEAALNAGGKLQSDNNPWDDREEIFGLGEEEEDLKRII